MLRVGLTGGIGSGKSTAAEQFRELGVPVIDADDIARQLTSPGSPAVELIEQELGPGYVDASGTLDRHRLAEQIFSDADARRQLEAILHPAVRERMVEELQSLVADYVILVIPLLLETGFTDLCDRVLVVDASEDTRIRRVQARDRRSLVQIQAIIARQASDAQRRAAADDILDNENTPAALAAAVRDLHHFYTGLARES